jgi:hypothetical protein
LSADLRAGAHEVDDDEIAVLRATIVGRGDIDPAAWPLLVDRNEAPAAVGQRPEDAEQAALA